MTTMAWKLGFACIALFCAAQVLSSPVQPAVGEKGFIGDIIAAQRAIEQFIASCEALYIQVSSSLHTVVYTIVTSVNSIIAQLKDLGLDPEDIQAIDDLAKQCVANIEGIFIGLLKDVTKVIDVAKDALSHKDNPIKLAMDMVKLRRAMDKLKADFNSMFDRILAEVQTLKNGIINVLANHTGEIVESIMSDIAAIENAILTEYNAVVSALDACIAAFDAALAALTNLFS